ncbi:MAG: hypothetical protein KIT31_00690 [Deltaproteobacteria bacterium]|nr:hypothetical protein [Deltaproteobacteria bacterium]
MKLLAKIGMVAAVGMGVGIAFSYAQPTSKSSSPTGTIAEMINASQATKAEIQKNLKRILHLREVARKEKDVIKLNCVNDKLVQVKPLMNIADSAMNSLESSSETDAPGLFAEVTEAAEQVRRLREESDQCVGESVLATESNSGYTAPDMPDSPYVHPFGTSLEPPAYASPFN